MISGSNIRQALNKVHSSFLALDAVLTPGLQDKAMALCSKYHAAIFAFKIISSNPNHKQPKGKKMP